MMVNKREGFLLTSTVILLILFGLSLLKIVQIENYKLIDSQGDLIEENDEVNEDDEAVLAVATADETHFLSWNTAQLKDITLNLTDKTFAKHDYIYDEAEKVIQEIENFFGQSLNHSIPVFIHSGESY